MTSSIHQSDSTRCVPRVGAFRRRGFTLTEMLVVVGILILLVGIASPMITRAWRAGDRARMQADLAAIASALESYKQDHGDYPRVKGLPWPGATGVDATDFLGARMLCRALIGPGPGEGGAANMIRDGAGTRNPPTAPTENANGPGFRTRDSKNGRVYGPYLPVDRFKIGNPTAPNDPTRPPGTWAILDRYNKPILYFPASTSKPNINVRGDPSNTPGYVHSDPGPTANNSEFSLYDADDNLNAFVRDGVGIQRMRLMLGDKNVNGFIEAPPSPTPETAATTADFLLWSAGPDETFGPDASLAAPTGTLDIRDAEKCDDVTNFRP